MNDTPSLDTEILKPYFQRMEYEDNDYCVKVGLFSHWSGVAFEVSIEVREPDFHGAHPQQKYAMERHGNGVPGHEGIHLQITYHPADNTRGTSKIYISINVGGQKDLVSTAQGFIFVLYQILDEFETEAGSIADVIFNVAYVKELQKMKPVIVQKILQSLETRGIEIHDKDGVVTRIGNLDELQQVIQARKELNPLLGPLLQG